MAIYVYNESCADIKCEDCGQGWDDYDMYRCDGCQKDIRAECKAETEIDCPNEFCESCV